MVCYFALFPQKKLFFCFTILHSKKLRVQGARAPCQGQGRGALAGFGAEPQDSVLKAHTNRVGVSGESFGLCKAHDIVFIVFQGIFCIVNEARFFDEAVY